MEQPSTVQGAPLQCADDISVDALSECVESLDQRVRHIGQSPPPTVDSAPQTVSPPIPHVTTQEACVQSWASPCSEGRPAQAAEQPLAAPACTPRSPGRPAAPPLWQSGVPEAANGGREPPQRAQVELLRENERLKDELARLRDELARRQDLGASQAGEPVGMGRRAHSKEGRAREVTFAVDPAEQDHASRNRGLRRKGDKKEEGVQRAQDTLAEQQQANSSKFVSEGILAGADNTDRPPQKLCVFDKGYRPPVHSFQAVRDLDQWSDPKDRLWPKVAIDDLQANCYLMVQRHSHGEPVSVVVPLFVYSTQLFEREVWAVWVPITTDTGRWEECGEAPLRGFLAERQPPLQEDAAQFTLTDQAEALVKAVLGSTARSLLRPDDTGTCTIDTSGLTLKEVTPIKREGLAGAAPADPRAPDLWRGLRLYAGPRVRLRSDESDLLGGSLCSEKSDTTVGSSTLVLAHFTRESVRTEPARSLSPLADRVLWLPPPCVFLPEEPEGAEDQSNGQAGEKLWRLIHPTAGTVGLTKGQPPPMPPSGASRLVWDTTGRDRGRRTSGWSCTSSPTSPAAQEMEFFANFLPPGLLEYIYAHRSEEKLLRRYEDGSTHPDAKLLFRVCKDPATCKGHTAKASELAKSCLEMRNQQEFTAKHAEDLFSLLKPGEAEADEWRERVRQLVLVKTGYEIPAGGGDAAAVPAAQLQAEDQKRLTPLNIAHCLDLQEVEYHPVGPGDGAAKQFTVAFSGRPFAVYCHERGRCLPLFRMATFYPDQPYWHLNCAVRHLQQQNLRCTLTVKENHGAKSKAVRPHSWIKGTYIVREPTEVGQGLRLLDQVMWDKDPLRVMRDPIQWLLGSGWRDTFAAPERWCWYVPSERDARPLGGDGCAAADPSQRKPVTERDTRPRWIFRRARDGRDRQEWSFPAAPAPWIGRAAASAVAAAVATASTGTGDVPQAQGTPSTPETQALPGTCGGQAAGDQGAQDPYDFFTYRLNLGTWMLKAARPLIWHINQALSSMRPVAGRYRCAPEPETLFYRGLKDTTLPAEVYAKGKVLLWGQFSSSSRDQGIALTFAKGRNASIFTLQGSSCRLIAPWSRFAREEEWLYGLNTLWYLENLLSEQQQQIISQSMQLYEMEEVTQAKVHVIQVRSALMHANAASSAAMVFGCLEALDNGGILNLALRSPDDGQTDGIWSFRTEVEYDAGGQCPVKTSRLWAECGSCGDAQALCRALPVAADGAQGARFAAQNDGASDAADSTLLRAAGGQKPVMYAARLFNITLSTKGCTPDTVSLVRARLAAPPSSQRPSHHQGQMAEVRVESRRRRWAFRAELRHQPGRHGNAVRDEGAGLLAKILRGGVPIKHVDLRNNQITAQGARALLAALRHNEHVASMVLERVSTLSALQEGERAESDVGSEAPGDGAPGDDQREVPKTSLEHLTVEELQHVINIRCLHNQGLLSAESVMGLGENWHTYAARALADCAQLQFDWGLIFDECAHDRTRLLEVTDFVRGLRPQGKAGSAASGGPKLPGALVAAARAGCRQMVKELLDAGADTREADSHGETALVKMRRRLANAAHYHHQLQPRHRIQRTEAWRKEWDDELRAQQRLLPLRYYYGKLLRRALAVLQQLEPTGRPPVLAEPRRPHDALWCAKEFALSAMRIWHARVESMRSDGHWCQVMKGVTRNGDQLAGSYIVFELLQHLFHWGLLANPTQHCPNCGSRHWYGEPEEMCERCIGSRLSCRYPLQNIRKHGSKLIAVPRAAPHSTLALEPVSRVGVTLLCYDYFLRNRRWMPPNGDSPEEIAQRLCPSDGKQGERCEEQSLQESPRAADPLASGAAESVQTELLSTANGMLYAERCREQRAVGAEGQLGPWIMLWAMAGCVPSLCPKDKVTLTTCMPCTSTVFEHILGLSRGDDFVIPGPSRWIRGQQGKRSGVEEDAAAEALCPSDVAYRVTLRVSGRLAFEEVGPLLAHGSAGDAADMVMRQVLLPALSMFVVDSVRSSDGARGAGGGAEGSGAKSGGGAQPSASGEGRCHVVMDLFSRGSLLDGDPELRSWRQEVLQQAEAAEALLEIGVAERSLHSGSPRGGGATQSHPEVKLYKLIRQACTSTEREDQELAAAKERQQGRREQLRRSEAKGADAEAALSAARGSCAALEAELERARAQRREAGEELDAARQELAQARAGAVSGLHTPYSRLLREAEALRLRVAELEQERQQQQQQQQQQGHEHLSSSAPQQCTVSPAAPGRRASPPPAAHPGPSASRVPAESPSAPAAGSSPRSCAAAGLVAAETGASAAASTLAHPPGVGPRTAVGFDQEVAAVVQGLRRVVQDAGAELAVGTSPRRLPSPAGGRSPALYSGWRGAGAAGTPTGRGPRAAAEGSPRRAAPRTWGAAGCGSPPRASRWGAAGGSSPKRWALSGERWGAAGGGSPRSADVRSSSGGLRLSGTERAGADGGSEGADAGLWRAYAQQRRSASSASAASDRAAGRDVIRASLSRGAETRPQGPYHPVYGASAALPAAKSVARSAHDSAPGPAAFQRPRRSPRRLHSAVY